MRLGIIGMGKMGQLIATLACAQGHSVLPFHRGEALTAVPEIFLDFSSAEAVVPHLEELCLLKRSVVIGTTGWEHKSAETLVNEGGIGALYAPNFSLGVARFMRLLENAQKLLPTHTAAGVEIHHSAKKDAPSGTARAMTECYGIPFSSVRVGQCVGIHEIIFDSVYDEITLTHRSKTRESYAQGALDVALWLHNKTGWRTLDEYLYSSHHSL